MLKFLQDTTLTEVEQRVLLHVYKNRPISARQLVAKPPAGVPSEVARLTLQGLVEKEWLRLGDSLVLLKE